MIRFTRVTWNNSDYVLLPGYISVDDLANVDDLMNCIYETPIDKKIDVTIESLLCKLDTELPEEQEKIRDATIEELEYFLDDDDNEDDNEDDDNEDDDNEEDDNDSDSEEDEDDYEDTYSSIIDTYIKENNIAVIDVEEISFDGENRELDIVELNL